MIKFYTIYGLFIFLSNLTQASMPMYLNQLKLSNHVYGWFIALVSMSTFIASISFSKVVSKISLSKFVSLNLIIYSLSQYVFFNYSKLIYLCLSRIGVGLSSGFIGVAGLSIVLNRQNAKMHISVYAIVQCLMSAIGFCLGGFLAQFMFKGVYFIQILGSFTIGLMSCFLLSKQVYNHQKEEGVKKKLSKDLILFLVCIFFINLGYFTHDTWLTFYFKQVYHFSSSHVGIYRLAIGVSSVVMNMVIMFYFKYKRYLLGVILVLCVLMLVGCLCVEQREMFLLLTLFYSVLTVTFLPLQQMLLAHIVDSSNQNSSYFNAVRSLSMCVAPFCFNYLSSYSHVSGLIFTPISFIIALLILIFILRQNKGVIED